MFQPPQEAITEALVFLLNDTKANDSNPRRVAQLLAPLTAPVVKQTWEEIVNEMPFETEITKIQDKIHPPMPAPLVTSGFVAVIPNATQNKS